VTGRIILPITLLVNTDDTNLSASCESAIDIERKPLYNPDNKAFLTGIFSFDADSLTYTNTWFLHARLCTRLVLSLPHLSAPICLRPNGARRQLALQGFGILARLNSISYGGEHGRSD